ncbi:hypothetical protein MASR1M48_16710 [Lactococcus petauri]
MRKIFNKLVLWFMQTDFYGWLLMKIIPFIRFTTYYTSFKGWQYHRGYLKLKKGDFILTVDRKKLTSVLIPGYYSHAGQCISKDGDWEISEMTHTNYTKSCFFDMCKESDEVAIFRCTDYDDEYIEKVIEKCKSFHDALYDNEFSLGIKSLYCSELVYSSDFERRLQVSLDDLAGLGRPYISPNGLAKGKNVIMVWSSKDEVR